MLRQFIISLFLVALPSLKALAQLEPVEFRTYYPGKHFSPIKSGTSDPAYLAIRSMSEWSEVWNQLHPLSHRTPSASLGKEISPQQEPVPLIDFSMYTLIMAASGRQPSLGYAVAYASIFRDRNSILVNVLKTSPGRECGIVDAPTKPISLALIPRTDQKIVFDIAEVKLDCVGHQIRHVDAPDGLRN
jgi:hypothetical protein